MDRYRYNPMKSEARATYRENEESDKALAGSTRKY